MRRPTVADDARERLGRHAEVLKVLPGRTIQAPAIVEQPFGRARVHQPIDQGARLIVDRDAGLAGIGADRTQLLRIGMARCVLPVPVPATSTACAAGCMFQNGPYAFLSS
jgi:hypothetical protein